MGSIKYNQDNPMTEDQEDADNMTINTSVSHDNNAVDIEAEEEETEDKITIEDINITTHRYNLRKCPTRCAGRISMT